jgi:hypothetical protein
MGHVYELLGCLDSTGKKTVCELQDVELLKKLCIRYNA